MHRVAVKSRDITCTQRPCSHPVHHADRVSLVQSRYTQTTPCRSTHCLCAVSSSSQDGWTHCYLVWRCFDRSWGALSATKQTAVRVAREVESCSEPFQGIFLHHLSEYENSGLLLHHTRHLDFLFSFGAKVKVVCVRDFDQLMWWKKVSVMRRMLHIIICSIQEWSFERSLCLDLIRHLS